MSSYRSSRSLAPIRPRLCGARPGQQRWLLAVLGLLVLIATTAAAQEQPPNYALIFGTVWSNSNLPVYGVKVKIRRKEDKRARWELVSNHQGEFAQRVPQGEAEYVVWIDGKSKKDKPLAEVEVHIKGNERADIGLHLTQ